MNLRLPKTFIVVAVLSLVLAAALTETVLYARNTPANHPEWSLGKRLVDAPMLVSNRDLLTRNLVRKNRFNFGEWHGFQEILFSERFRLGSLRTKVSLSENGYLIIQFNRDAEGYSGVRLSRNPKFPNLFFRASASGGFLEREALPALALKDGWHEVDLKFEANLLNVTVDGELLAKLEETSGEGKIIGFKGGYHPVSVDLAEASDGDGKVRIRENFSNDRGRWGLLAGCFAVIFALMVGAYHLGKPRRGDTKAAVFSLIAVQFFAICTVLMYFAFDYFFWSYKYIFDERRTLWEGGPDMAVLLEDVRKYAFTEFPFAEAEQPGSALAKSQALIDYLKMAPQKRRIINLKVTTGSPGQQQFDIVEASIEGVEAYLGGKCLESSMRVLILGTSQMWGSGAAYPRDRIEAGLHRILSENFGGEIAFTVINASVRGSNAGRLLKDYQAYLHLFKPHFTVVNLSNNDIVQGFGRRLSALLEYNKTMGAQILFVLEPNSTESPDPLSQNHATMIDVAKQNDIPWADLQGYLDGGGVHDAGILWWDKVHLTSYGQALAASFIARGVLRASDFMSERNTLAVCPENVR